jgi:uncharacterized protein
MQLLRWFGAKVSSTGSQKANMALIRSTIFQKSGEAPVKMIGGVYSIAACGKMEFGTASLFLWSARYWRNSRSRDYHSTRPCRLTRAPPRRLDKVMQKRHALFSILPLLALVGGLAQGSVACAQERSANPVPNTIWVGADGKFDSEPDTAQVQFSISAQEEKLADATQKANQAAEQIRQLLRSNGIDPQEAQISRFATQPVYDYKTPKRKLVGYRVEAGISIKLKDFTKVGPIVQGLSNMEVTDTSINYLLEKIDAAKVKAVQDALTRARDMANAVAQASHRTLGDLSYASIDTYEAQPVRPMMMAKSMGVAADAASAPPTAEFSAEKISVTAHVNALYNLK